MFIQEHNCLTGEIIHRDLTKEEIAVRENEYALKEEKRNAKIEARAALLERLGITEEEAKLLLG